MIKRRNPPTKQQVRVYLRPEALTKATIVSENTGRSLSDVFEDAILKNSPLQMEIGMRMQTNRTTKEQFLNELKEAKREAMNDVKPNK